MARYELLNNIAHRDLRISTRFGAEFGDNGYTYINGRYRPRLIDWHVTFSNYIPGVRIEVGLAEAAQWLALPHAWGLTQPASDIGGAHAGYRVYPCADGRVAVAALEPHFAARLCLAASLEDTTGDPAVMRAPATHAAIADFVRQQSRAQLDALAAEKDIPLFTLA